MRDFYLKFESKEEARKELLKAGFTQEEGDKFPSSHPKAVVDVIGVITAPTGEIDNINGVEFEVTAPIPGYHVNVRTWCDTCTYQMDQSQFIVKPKTPIRVWA